MDTEIDYYKVITKMLGPIKPIGETNTDEKRNIVLSEVFGLVDSLIDDIADVAQYKDRSEYSMGRAGQRAADYLRNLKESIDL